MEHGDDLDRWLCEAQVRFPTTMVTTTTSTTVPGCPCEGTSFSGITWGSSFQTFSCDNNGTSSYVLRQQPVLGTFAQLRITRDGSRCDILAAPSEMSNFRSLTPGQRDACVQSLMRIAGEDGISCPPSPF